MKKLILLGFSALFILLSCSKDDMGKVLKPVDLAVPADKSTIKTDVTTLSWKKHSDITAKYDVYISKTSEFGEGTLFKSDYFETSVVSPKLDGNVLYHWKIVVKNLAKEQADSKEFTFKTALFAPMKPQLISPKENINTKEDDIKLVWSENTLKNVEYSVFLGKKKDLTDSDIIKTGLKDNSFLVKNLEKGVSYYWKIQVTPSDYKQPINSEIFSFSSGNQLPSVPVLTYPRDGMLLAPIGVNLLWDRSTDLDNEKIVYDIYLDDDKTFGDERNIEKNFDGKKITYTGLKYNTVYYWKVIARDEQGAEVSSKLFHFKTCQDPETKLLSPIDGFNGTSLEKLTWEAKEGFKYEVKVSKSEGFSDADIYKKDITVGEVPFTEFQYNTKYIWKVVAYDKAGNPFETASRSFNIKKDIADSGTGSFTDVDGIVYNTVIINGVEWMAQNLRRIPDMSLAGKDWLIPGVPIKVNNKKNPVYESIETVKENPNYLKYGLLYSANLISVKENVPNGWHLPLDFEWNNMEEYLGVDPSTLYQMDYRGIHAPSLESDVYTDIVNGVEVKWTDATNESKFSAIPAGFGEIDWSNYPNLKPMSLGEKAYFWTATKTTKQICRVIYNSIDAAKYKGVKRAQLSANRLLSIRLIKGEAPSEPVLKEGI